MKKQPHDVLGIARNSSEDEIKSAYKTLAKKYHPDINKEENASEKFTEISEAFDAMMSNTKKSNHFYSNTDINIDDFLSGFSKKSYIKKNIILELSPLESHYGVEKYLTIGNNVYRIQILEGLLSGDKQTIDVGTQKFTIEVKITSPLFKINNSDIGLTKRLTAIEFLDSSTIEVENHLGKKFNVNIPKNMDTNTTLRVKGAGLYSRKNSTYGNLNINIVVYK